MTPRPILGKVTYGSPGQGTTSHSAVEEFADKAGIKLEHVPFKGFADSRMHSMLGGHVDAQRPTPRAGCCTWRPAWRGLLLLTYGPKRNEEIGRVADASGVSATTRSP